MLAPSPLLLPLARICSGVMSGDFGGCIGGVVSEGSCSRRVRLSIACVRGERGSGPPCKADGAVVGGARREARALLET